jgi:hypothetical protein
MVESESDSMTNRSGSHGRRVPRPNCREHAHCPSQLSFWLYLPAERLSRLSWLFDVAVAVSSDKVVRVEMERSQQTETNDGAAPTTKSADRRT